MIRFAVVNPTFGNLEGVSFSLFSCRKRLIYFRALKDDGSFLTNPKLRPKSVRVKITPARDYDRMRSVFMFQFRVPPRCRILCSQAAEVYTWFVNSGQGSVRNANVRTKSKWSPKLWMKA